jgi:hypothetical protein
MEFRLAHPTKEMNRKSLRVLMVGGGVAGSALTARRSQMRIGWSRNSFDGLLARIGNFAIGKLRQTTQCNQSKCDTSNSAISAIEQPTTDCKKLKTIMQEVASSKNIWPV